MEVRLSLSDGISPALLKLATAVQRRDIMEAAGLALLSHTRRTFQESALRPAPWPARLGSTAAARNESGQFVSSGNTHPLLKKSGTLWRSIALTNVSASSASVTSDRIYAAIHQYGGIIKPKSAGGSLKFQMPGGAWVNTKQVKIPARPFFPIMDGKPTPAIVTKLTKVVTLKLQSLADQVS